MKYEEILEQFEVKENNGSMAKCICPVHGGDDAQLTITKTNNGIFNICCQAGCSEEKILDAVGLLPKDLIDENACEESEHADIAEVKTLAKKGSKDIPPLQCIRADELYNKELPEQEMIVDGMICGGLTILAGPPKCGKSWFALDMCLSVATGTDFMGREVRQCDALYLALEDIESRTQERMKKVLNDRKAPGNCIFVYKTNKLEDGLLIQLDDCLDENPAIKLIVIDTFQCIRSGGVNGGSSYSADYREARKLKEFADSHGLALVLVHHTNKKSQDSKKKQDVTDPFATISGTNGLSGAADTLMVITQDEDCKDKALLSIKGRDIESDDLYITFDCGGTYRWECVGPEKEYEEMHKKEEYDKNPVVCTIRKLLEQENGKWKGTATKFVDAGDRYKFFIPHNPRELKAELKSLALDLFKYDSIVCDIHSNGNAGAIYYLYYAADAEVQTNAVPENLAPIPADVSDTVAGNETIAEIEAFTPCPDEEDIRILDEVSV